jgi:hypothetical protein
MNATITAAVAAERHNDMVRMHLGRATPAMRRSG